jgi:aspartate/methionine/tyrosine aminotransferase
MLPDFRLETHFAVWEFKARHHLTASDAESVTLGELLSFGTDKDRDDFMSMRLGYTETRGAPELRQEIANTYDVREAGDILCFAGAEEGIYATFTTLLEANDHAIVVVPAYQSLESVPASICRTTSIPLELKDRWVLDIDRVEDAIRPETKAIAINFPHNPTGALLPDADLHQLIEICRRRGIWLFSDEAYRPLGPIGGRQSPQVADLYEGGISLGVMSKAYGLPGLRIGWIACGDRDLLKRVEKTKYYLSICNAGPSERLAMIALRARDRILERNSRIVSDGIEQWTDFFSRHEELFEWIPPVAGCVAYPRFKGAEGIETFAAQLVDEAGVLVLPASIYASPAGQFHTEHFRVGAGRLGLTEGLRAFDQFLADRKA